jgi:hypothetical protein
VVAVVSDAMVDVLFVGSVGCFLVRRYFTVINFNVKIEWNVMERRGEMSNDCDGHIMDTNLF